MERQRDNQYILLEKPFIKNINKLNTNVSISLSDNQKKKKNKEAPKPLTYIRNPLKYIHNKSTKHKLMRKTRILLSKFDHHNHLSH